VLHEINIKGGLTLNNIKRFVINGSKLHIAEYILYSAFEANPNDLFY
jgi:hypothetical protein